MGGAWAGRFQMALVTHLADGAEVGLGYLIPFCMVSHLQVGTVRSKVSQRTRAEATRAPYPAISQFPNG